MNVKVYCLYTNYSSVISLSLQFYNSFYVYFVIFTFCFLFFFHYIYFNVVFFSFLILTSFIICHIHDRTQILGLKLNKYTGMYGYGHPLKNPQDDDLSSCAKPWKRDDFLFVRLTYIYFCVFVNAVSVYQK